MATATEGEWITVSRRRNTTGNHPPQTNPYRPYQATYADVVRRKCNSLPNSVNSTTKSSTPSSSNPFSARTPANPLFYISQHSRAQLRFPPSPSYKEWKGRCFRCCRMGHNAARCRNLRRCGKCWGEGHIGTRCRQAIPNPAVTPFWSSKEGELKKVCTQCEPKFDDLFAGPIISKPLPEGRPQKIVCFVERDEEYYDEMSNLERAVVMYNSNLELNLSIEQVAQFAARSGMVKPDEISIGIMTRSRYVIMLPHGVDPDKFIRAIPVEVWKEGYSFYQWSPLDDSSKLVPHYKVLLDLVGIPLDLYREREVIRATCGFGTYLGTVEQLTQGDIACWTVVVAATDLSQIPHQVAFRIAGREKLVDVIPKTWIHCPVYQDSELAQPREQFKPIFPDEETSLSSDDNTSHRCDDEFMGSRKVLEDLCRGRDIESLPAGVRQVLAGAKSMVVTQTQQEVATENTLEVTCMATPPQCVENLVEEINHTSLDVNPVAMHGSHSFHEAGHSTPKNDSFQDMEARSSLQITPITLYSPLCVPDSQPMQRSSLNKIRSDSAAMEGSSNQPRILERGKDKIFDDLPNHISLKATLIPSKSPAVKEFSPIALRKSTLQKRKLSEQAREIKAQEKFSKKANRAKGKQARIKPNEDGFLEVQVSYELCSKIASGSGFQTEQVIQALSLDNEERRNLAAATLTPDVEEDQGEHITDDDFNPDSDDELDSDLD